MLDYVVTPKTCACCGSTESPKAKWLEISELAIMMGESDTLLKQITKNGMNAYIAWFERLDRLIKADQNKFTYKNIDYIFTKE